MIIIDSFSCISLPNQNYDTYLAYLKELHKIFRILVF
jgi:hypothetical protein